MKYLRKLLITILQIRLRIATRRITKTIIKNNRVRKMIILSLQW